jgi:hypothetical protein
MDAITPQNGVSDLYLDLLKKSLTNILYYGSDVTIRYLIDCLEGKNTYIRNVFLTEGYRRDLEQFRDGFLDGKSQSIFGYTLVGMRRLDNIQACVDDVISNDVPGDLLEAGVWRGGASIFMRGMLKARGITDRTAWLADSFEGLPAPDLDRYPADEGMKLHELPIMAVSLEQVKENFAAFDLLDDQVKFMKGWFRDTLPQAPVGELAVLRADGDMYESTTQILDNLYDKVSPGGYVIIDDYGDYGACRQAVDEFRERRGITDPLVVVDWSGVYWQKT